MAGTIVWKKNKAPFLEGKVFLRQREACCVGACSRLIRGVPHIWTAVNNDETLALLLYSRRSLFPIFNGNRDIPLPRFLDRLLQKVPPHSLQGLREDTEILGEAIEIQGFCAADRIDYDLMTLDREPPSECFSQGPEDLVIRPPVESDREALFALHAAYEREEVIPRGGLFDPRSSMKTLEHILGVEYVAVACLGNKLVGKINTNAESFTRYQIGGVYVQPEYRGLGIGVKMSALFLRRLIRGGRGITLFVKKRNAPAQALYRRLGFLVHGDYRINYFE